MAVKRAASDQGVAAGCARQIHGFGERALSDAWRLLTVTELQEQEDDTPPGQQDPQEDAQQAEPEKIEALLLSYIHRDLLNVKEARRRFDSAIDVSRGTLDSMKARMENLLDVETMDRADRYVQGHGSATPEVAKSTEVIAEIEDTKDFIARCKEKLQALRDKYAASVELNNTVAKETMVR
jgi:hypothetical protein